MKDSLNYIYGPLVFTDSIYPEDFKEARKVKLKLTQEELSSLLGCSRQTVAKCEVSGYNIPKYLSLAICLLLNKLYQKETDNEVRTNK